MSTLMSVVPTISVLPARQSSPRPSAIAGAGRPPSMGLAAAHRKISSPRWLTPSRSSSAGFAVAKGAHHSTSPLPRRNGTPSLPFAGSVTLHHASSSGDLRLRSRSRDLPLAGSASPALPAACAARTARPARLPVPTPKPSRASLVAAPTLAATAATTFGTTGQHQPLGKDALAKMPVSFGKPDAGEGAPVRVLCYGDSLTAGFADGGCAFEPYGRALAEAMAGLGTPCEVSVCGLSGKTASEMVAGMDSGLTDMMGNWGKGLRRALREDGPFDLVVIMAGTNDIGYGHRPEEIVKDVRQLHVACHELGVKTCLLPPPSAPCGDAPWHATRRQAKQRMEEFAESMSSIACVIDPSTIVPAIAGSAASGASMWDPDKLHFSPVGSRCLGKELAPRILASLQRPKRHSAPAKISLQVPPRAPRGPANGVVAAALATRLSAVARSTVSASPSASPAPTFRPLLGSPSTPSITAAKAASAATATPTIIRVPSVRHRISCHVELADNPTHRECGNVIPVH